MAKLPYLTIKFGSVEKLKVAINMRSSSMAYTDDKRVGSFGECHPARKIAKLSPMATRGFRELFY